MKRLLIIVTTVCLVLSACASSAPAQKSERDQALEALTAVRTSAPTRPDWIANVGKYSDSKTLAFRGENTLRFSIEGQARDNAIQNGLNQLVQYYGTKISDKARTYTATYGIATDVMAPQIAGQQLQERLTEGLAQQLFASQDYWELFLDRNNDEYYNFYVLQTIPTAAVAKVIDDYGKAAAADLQQKAAAERDASRRQQLEKSAEFFGGNLSGTLLE
jgi:protein involved in sex pheromone biosynthesis